MQIYGCPGVQRVYRQEWKNLIIIVPNYQTHKIQDSLIRATIYTTNLSYQPWKHTSKCSAVVLAPSAPQSPRWWLVSRAPMQNIKHTRQRSLNTIMVTPIPTAIPPPADADIILGIRSVPVHHHRRNPSIGDKIPGAMMRLRGSLMHRPGGKVWILPDLLKVIRARLIWWN